MKKNYMIVCLAMMLGISAQTMAQTDPGTTNLKHRWTFEGTGVTAPIDNIGGVTGTLMEGATISNGYLDISAGGYVNLDAAALNIKSYTELSVEAWFTSSFGANDGYRFLYYFGNSDGNGNHCTGYTPTRGNKVSRVLMDTGSGEPGVNALNQYDDGVLHHVVAVIDASTLSYYMDGVLVNSTPIGASSLANVGNQLAYFAKGGWPDPTWKGTIQEISIYNKVLTLDNVKYLYDLHKIVVPVTPTNPGTTNLTHKWTFDVDANDQVGTLNGTLVGGATIADKALNVTTGGYVTLDAAALAINTYTDLTVESWFTPVAGGNDGFRFLYYFGKSDGGGNHFTGFTPNRGGGDLGRFMIATGTNGEDDLQRINTPNFSDGGLHHSVCVINGTSLTAYIDGNLLGTTTIGISSLANVCLHAPVGKGNDFAYFGKGGWPDDPWKGQIHEISIYNNSLTAGNVKYLFNLGPEPTNGGSTGINTTKKLAQNVYVSNNRIVAQFESSSAASSKIEIYNIQGLLLSSEAFTCSEGLNTKIVDVVYPSGIYMVRLVVAGQAGYAKIVK